MAILPLVTPARSGDAVCMDVLLLLVFLLLLTPATLLFGADSRRAGGWDDPGVWNESYPGSPGPGR
ncbi:hypothetical protein NUM3379_11020 [Kineococcus sp. NUM-3379]